MTVSALKGDQDLLRLRELNGDGRVGKVLFERNHIVFQNTKSFSGLSTQDHNHLGFMGARVFIASQRKLTSAEIKGLYASVWAIESSC